MNRADGPRGVLSLPGAAGLGVRWWRLLVGVAIAAWMMWRLDMVERLAVRDLQFALSPALAGVAMTFVLISVRAWRWNMILGETGTPLSAARLASVYGASTFLGLVSPARLGELARAWWTREAAGGLPAATFSVAFDRAFDLAPALMLVGLLGALVALPQYAAAITLFRVVLVVLGLLVAFAIARPDRVRRAVESLAARLLQRLGRAVDAHAAPTRRIGRAMVARAAALSLLSQAVALLQMWLFARAVGIELNPMTMYAVISMATMVSALPLSVAGVGTREATVVWSLASLGVAAAPAATFALLWLANFLVMLGVSLMAFAHHREPSGACDGRTAGNQRGGK